MLQGNAKALAGIGRSKPFMLFVLICLTGYIYLHFSATGSQINDQDQALLPPRHQIAPKISRLDALSINDQSETSKILSVDALPLNNQSEVDNIILADGLNEQNQSEIDKIINKVLLIDPKDANDRTCKKKINVSFLKVHKAGSTTVMNIFLRFAISNRLNIVLPPKPQGFGFNYLGYGKTVSKDNIVPIPNNESYNILCNHVVYNKTAFRSIMPKDTFYVGILREPKSHFRSAATYYGFYGHLKTFAEKLGLNADTIISEYLKAPDKFSVGTYFVYNRMSFDLGIPKSQFHDDAFVDAYIDELGQDYGLMMIMERFEESLVLLKRSLCWSIKDILYVPLNARHSVTPFTFTDDDVTRLKSWNSADFKLYDHFRRVFDEKVEAEGRDFFEEVQNFKEIRETVVQYCSGSKKSLKGVLMLPETKWGDVFEVTPEDCSLMTENELSMMSRLIKQAWERYDSA